MTTLGEYVEMASHAAGDLAVGTIAVASLWWHELFANEAHVLVIAGVVTLVWVRVVSAVFFMLLQIRNWRRTP